jgi:hypothetical protein
VAIQSHGAEPTGNYMMTLAADVSSRNIDNILKLKEFI